MTSERFPQTFGPYQLLEKLAQGGMADIFKVQRQDQPDKVFALKRLKRAYMYDSEFVEMLKSEAETLRSLHSTHLIEVYDSGTIEDYFYILMEFIDGVSWRELRLRGDKSGTPLSRAAILSLAQQVCSALDDLHRVRNLVHTDLAARNVLVDRSGNAKLIDFSAAQMQLNMDKTITEGNWGLMHEMAPERLSDKGGPSLNERSDIFQLGLILHHQWIGKHLFEGKVGFPLYVAIREVNVTAESLPNNWDPELKSLLIQSLARDPKDRFPSAEHFGRKLDEYLKKHFPEYGKQELAQEIGAILAAVPEKTPVKNP